MSTRRPVDPVDHPVDLDADGDADADADEVERAAVVGELGLVTELHGDGLRGTAEITPETWVPGTQVVRTSVLATWVDVVAGLLSGWSMRPRVSVTLDLDVHLHHQPVGTGAVSAVASIVKAGRSVVVSAVELTLAGDTAPFAVASASFMPSPNPDHLMPVGFPLAGTSARRRLTAPLAERAGVKHVAAGVAQIPWRTGNINASGSIQGGLIALAVEEAVLSAAEPTVLRSLSVRYLRAFRHGPARATATVRGDLARVEVVDVGHGARLGLLATAWLAPPAG
jgi:acyl-coenzyme A thioesterase PaaI-like protein